MRSITASAAPLLLFAVVSCSPSAGTSEKGLYGTSGSGGTPGAGNSGNGGDGAGAGSGAGPSGSSGFTGFGSGPSTDGGGTTPDGGCFSSTSEAEQVVVTKEITTQKPVDMFIMLDQSGSMNDQAGSSTKWQAITGALTTFVNDPGSAGIGVGIGYFPFTGGSQQQTCKQGDPNCFCIPFINICTVISNFGGSCNVSDYSTPEVPIQVLPGVASAITSSLSKHGPGGGTPTAPALTGATQYASQWAAAHPDRKTIVVLATDGDPTGCTGNAVQDVANIASGAHLANPSVDTFVIGVGSSLTSLNAIAAAGGTGQALIVDTSANPGQQFLDAMNKIRTVVTEQQTTTQVTQVPCQWTIPPAPDGQTFDKTKVNVDFTSSAGKQQIGAVPTQNDCANAPNGNGWYYDNPDAPTVVLVCPQTCTTIQGTPSARIDVVFGCATIPAIVQ
jgi:hypothetical protein